MDAALKMFEMAEKYSLTARRIHDARHAAVAITHGIDSIYTYEVNDCRLFKPDGIKIVMPPSVIIQNS